MRAPATPLPPQRPDFGYFFRPAFPLVSLPQSSARSRPCARQASPTPFWRPMFGAPPRSHRNRQLTLEIIPLIRSTSPTHCSLCSLTAGSSQQPSSTVHGITARHCVGVHPQPGRRSADLHARAVIPPPPSLTSQIASLSPPRPSRASASIAPHLLAALNIPAGTSDVRCPWPPDPRTAAPPAAAKTPSPSRDPSTSPASHPRTRSCPPP